MAPEPLQASVRMEAAPAMAREIHANTFCSRL
jgi:hypothetical protein